jgi:hypothetical protein
MTPTKHRRGIRSSGIVNNFFSAGGTSRDTLFRNPAISIEIFVNGCQSFQDDVVLKRKRTPQRQPRMDNPETYTTSDTQDIGRRKTSPR